LRPRAPPEKRKGGVRPSPACHALKRLGPVRPLRFTSTSVTFNLSGVQAGSMLVLDFSFAPAADSADTLTKDLQR
jgi:hypothetical protein